MIVPAQEVAFTNAAIVHILTDFKNATPLISSPEPKIGELIGYSWSGVRPASFTMLKDLLRNRFANQSQILYGASLGRGNDIMRHPSKIFSRTGGPIFTKHGM